MFIDKAYRKTEKKISEICIKIRWNFIDYSRNWKGVTNKLYEQEIVVSLTSFPRRIDIVSETIKSILLQTMKPNRIILWLASEQFPAKEQDLPITLTMLCKYGLDIKWCDDIKSYKKLIPTLKLYPNAIVITADDDILYRRNWIKGLYQSHQKYPSDVICHRASKFYLDDKGNYCVKGGGHDIWKSDSFLHKLTGCGGVLYPPNVFFDDICKSNIFMKICPTNDDIWFWLMAVLNGRRIHAVQSRNVDIIEVKGAENTPSLTSLNDHGEHLFWQDFYNMLHYYKELDNILKEEYQKMIILQ